MCPIHQISIDADHHTYRLNDCADEFDHEASQSASAKGIDLSDDIARILLANAAPTNMADGSIVTSVNQTGGQIAHSITNVGRQVVLNKQYAKERLTLETFAIDRSRCAYQEYRLDASRPFWPEEADPIGVCYMRAAGSVGMAECLIPGRKPRSMAIRYARSTIIIPFTRVLHTRCSVIGWKSRSGLIGRIILCFTFRRATTPTPMSFSRKSLRQCITSSLWQRQVNLTRCSRCGVTCLNSRRLKECTEWRLCPA